jgi:hypothetical protein
LSGQDERHFLVRVKKKLKRRFLEAYPDGSALVEITSGKDTRLVRELVGRVQRGGRGCGTTVRLWTSLLDWRRHPAAELLALYARRWEQEVFYKELKVDIRSTPYLQSHTPLTAIPRRRHRFCQRALRQPVSSWPRLRKNTYRKGTIEYSIGAIYA